MTNENKKIIVLLVEDEKILSKTLQERLISEGLNVITAPDGQEGLKMALENHPDIILLDLLMPKIDGLSMLKRLREDPWGLHVKVIILSNLSDPRKLTGGINIGLDDISEFILKTDYSLDDIVKEVKKKLEIIS